jgi:uncharacterized protein (TIGR03790 family)
MKARLIASYWLVLALTVLAPLLSLEAHEKDRVVILANAADPDSVRLAQYYAQQRQIPEANIISLAMPTEETISIRQYVDQIHNPLLAALIDADWMQAVRSGQRDAYGRELLQAALQRMSYLVTVRGVPLRIAHDPELIEADAVSLPEQFRVNGGSVDSELALLAAADRLSMTAFLVNPYFENKTTPQREWLVGIRVSRLDGPSVAAVKRLIDRSLQAEEFGLQGRAYFDTGGPHELGDTWIRAAGELAQAAYFDTDFESTKRKLDHRDRLDAPAIYMGWYAPRAYGPWRDSSWHVPPGAIGFHLHSFSATSVRSITKAWLGPLVQQGYCATFGNVYEPYLQFTHRPDLFLEHLLAGGTFGEAIAYSTPRWSWMGVAIGDPLYRPFKLSLSDQLELPQRTEFGSYVTLREVRRLQSEGDTAAALDFARVEFMKQPSLALAYEIAQLHEQRAEPEKALSALKLVRYLSIFPVDERVVAQRVADLLHRYGESQLAYDVYAKLIGSQQNAKVLQLRLLEEGAAVAATVGALAEASQWSLQAKQLKQAATPKGSRNHARSNK